MEVPAPDKPPSFLVMGPGSSLSTAELGNGNMTPLFLTGRTVKNRDTEELHM